MNSEIQQAIDAAWPLLQQLFDDSMKRFTELRTGVGRVVTDAALLVDEGEDVAPTFTGAPVQRSVRRVEHSFRDVRREWMRTFTADALCALRSSDPDAGELFAVAATDLEKQLVVDVVARAARHWVGAWSSVGALAGTVRAGDADAELSVLTTEDTAAALEPTPENAPLRRDLRTHRVRTVPSLPPIAGTTVSAVLLVTPSPFAVCSLTPPSLTWRLATTAAPRAEIVVKERSITPAARPYRLGFVTGELPARFL